MTLDVRHLAACEKLGSRDENVDHYVGPGSISKWKDSHCLHHERVNFEVCHVISVRKPQIASSCQSEAERPTTPYSTTLNTVAQCNHFIVPVVSTVRSTSVSRDTVLTVSLTHALL